MDFVKTKKKNKKIKKLTKKPTSFQNNKEFQKIALKIQLKCCCYRDRAMNIEIEKSTLCFPHSSLSKQEKEKYYPKGKKI